MTADPRVRRAPLVVVVGHVFEDPAFAGGCSLVQTSSVLTGVTAARTERPDVVLVNITAPGARRACQVLRRSAATSHAALIALVPDAADPIALAAAIGQALGCRERAGGGGSYPAFGIVRTPANRQDANVVFWEPPED
jgi:hypothetical protein